MRRTRQTIKNHEINIARSVKVNPKKFWNYVQSKSKTKSTIPDLYKDETKEQVTESDKEKANVLADFFYIRIHQRPRKRDARYRT